MDIQSWTDLYMNKYAEQFRLQLVQNMPTLLAFHQKVLLYYSSIIIVLLNPEMST